MHRYPLAFSMFWLLAVAAEPAIALPQGTDCSGPILDTMNGGGYTYVKVDCDQEQIWAAGPVVPVAQGQTVTISKTMPMTQFHSAALDRTFDTIYFVSEFGSSNAHGAGAATAEIGQAHEQTGLSPERMDFSNIERPAGGKTVAEIVASKNELAGKEVLVRGLVIKYSANVMSKNWIHLQDGTGEPGNNDLTITTADTAEVGDTVLVRGQVALDVDLGYGYQYEVVIEEASVIIE